MSYDINITMYIPTCEKQQIKLVVTMTNVIGLFTSS